MKGNLYIVAGCSGVGKGTLLKLFLEKNPQLKLSVSCTTRNPREGEVHGKNYFFISVLSKISSFRPEVADPDAYGS